MSGPSWYGTARKTRQKVIGIVFEMAVVYWVHKESQRFDSTISWLFKTWNLFKIS